MGLDSVELLMEFEKYFNVSIPDNEAEILYTIHTAVDCIAKHLNIDKVESDLQSNTLKKLIDAIKGINGKDISLNSLDPIADYFNPSDLDKSKYLSKSIGLELPEFDVPVYNKNSIFNRIKHFVRWQPMYEWSQVTVSQFSDAINMHNLENLVNKEQISNKYEIYIAVGRLTVDKIGVDYLEIQPDKSFTKDLGVD